MLVINVNTIELFDESRSVITKGAGFTIELEHSLASLSKWESIWEKPFLTETPKTPDEELSYIQCMCLGNVPDINDLKRLTLEDRKEINAYMSSKQTATWFNERDDKRKSTEIVTAEVIYYWMSEMNVPYECDKWHFNKLMTLIKVINLKKAPPKKMGRRETLAQARAINAQRRQQYGPPS